MVQIVTREEADEVRRGLAATLRMHSVIVEALRNRQLATISTSARCAMISTADHVSGAARRRMALRSQSLARRA